MFSTGEVRRRCLNRFQLFVVHSERILNKLVFHFAALRHHKDVSSLFCMKDASPFAVWQGSKIFLLSTSGNICCYYVCNLKLAQHEHSWSALFLSSPVGLPAYLCVSNNLVPRKREKLQLCSLLHIPPEELHTMFTENSGS